MSTHANPIYVERLLAEIARREQFKRYHDAAEGQQWFREQVAREANEHELDKAWCQLRETINSLPGETSPVYRERSHA